MNYRQIGSSGFPFRFYLVQSDDHLTPATGKSPLVSISKPSETSFAQADGAVTELGGGWYDWDGDPSDRAELGELAVMVTATGADAFPAKIVVVPWDPFDANLALQALPAAAPGAEGGLPTVDAANGVKLSVGTAAGQVVLNSGLVRADAVTGDVAGIAEVTFPAGFGTQTISGGMLQVDVRRIEGNPAGAATTVDANLVSVNGTVLPGASVPATIGDGAITAASFATNAISSAAFSQAAADRAWATTVRTITGGGGGGVDNEAIATAVWAAGARTLTSGANIALAKGTGVTGFNDITAASVWAVARSGNQASGSFGQVLDVAITSRLAAADYAPAGAGLTAEQVESAVWDGLAADHAVAGSLAALLTSRLDVAVGTRMAAAAGSALSADVAAVAALAAAIKAKTDALQALGKVVTVAGSPTRTVVPITGTGLSAEPDAYQGYLVFTTGALAQQAQPVSAYNGASSPKTVTLSAPLSAAPQAGDQAVLVGRNGLATS